MEFGTLQFTRISSRPFATSTRSCLLMREFAYLGATPDRQTSATAKPPPSQLIEEQILSKRGKALVIYGAAHFYRNAPASFGTSAELAKMLEKADPGRVYAVIPIGGELDPPPPSVSLRNPDYRKFESALKTQVRPVLIPLQRPPFRDFAAEEFLGGGFFSCAGPGGCRSAFAGSLLTLGQMADACIYLGDVGKSAKPGAQ